MHANHAKPHPTSTSCRAEPGAAAKGLPTYGAAMMKERCMDEGPVMEWRHSNCCPRATHYCGSRIGRRIGGGLEEEGTEEICPC